MVAPGKDRSVVVFDLCDTLYAVNTTVAFLRHYARSRNAPRVERALHRWTGRGSVQFYVGAVAHRLLKWDIARERLVASLAGERRTALETAAEEFAQSLSTRANTLLHDRLERHQAAGDRVIIVSNSLDLVVSPIARQLGAEFIATALGYDGEVCTGRLECDLTGRKASALRQLLGADMDICCVYTDNRSDLDIVALARNATIVVPSGRREVHWGGSHCEYIRL